MVIKRPKAYIVHEPKRFDRELNTWMSNVDLSSATEYGDLVFLLNTPERPPLDPEASLPTLREKMKHFTADDYLVLAGDMNLVVYAAALALRATGGTINLLRWHPRDKRYISLPSTIYEDEAEPKKKRISR